MGVGSMKKPAADIPKSALSPEIDEFVKGAKVHHGDHLSPQGEGVASRKPRKDRPAAKQVRLTFSLDAEVDALVERLSLIPCGYRASRSDVIRAALTLLAEQGDEKVAEHLRRVCKK